MKNITMILLVVFCGLRAESQAQCSIRQIKTINGLQKETPDAVCFMRQGKKYHALFIRAVSLNQNNAKIFKLKVNYAAMNLKDIANLQFLGVDTISITTVPVLTGHQKTDNPLINTQSYGIKLNSSMVDFLSSHKLRSIILIIKGTKNRVVIPVDDPSFLINGMQCLKAG